MVKSDFRVCMDCGGIFNRLGLKPVSDCPACDSENHESLEL